MPNLALLALEASDGTVVLTSITLVFAMLVALCLIITLEGKIFDAINNKKNNKPAAPKASAAPAAKAAPAPAAKPAAPAAKADNGSIPGEIIAAISVAALLVALGMEVYRMFTTPGYFSGIDTYLHNILTIVVGLEFVRMLIDTTPSNILEVLTVAITRHVILSHDDPLSNLACIVCIAGLFATRRFLVRRTEMKEDLNED